MEKNQFSEEQVIAILSEGEAGAMWCQPPPMKNRSVIAPLKSKRGAALAAMTKATDWPAHELPEGHEDAM